ncbi:hypothetical protein HAX54_025172 [Datura stramonium]|uniref:Uncharacterized protein n=1 Tax=Datura stramonium TaxID=4076 RepID=A0ABS8UZA0_DATST|nr:hypothetical protein [Datura stramonium]
MVVDQMPPHFYKRWWGEMEGYDQRESKRSFGTSERDGNIDIRLAGVVQALTTMDNPTLVPMILAKGALPTLKGVATCIANVILGTSPMIILHQVPLRLV